MDKALSKIQTLYNRLLHAQQSDGAVDWSAFYSEVVLLRSWLAYEPRAIAADLCQYLRDMDGLTVKTEAVLDLLRDMAKQINRTGAASIAMA